MIAHGTLPVVAPRSASPSSWRTRPRLGRPGQHVDIGEVGQPLLRLADLGDVGTDAAEAFEAAGGIDDRVARDRNPAAAARRLQLHLERVERLFLEQQPAELGMAAEKRREANGRAAGWPGLPSRALMRELM